ncbi:DEKNAAC102644 [Brettanomyces naardenensis]|uniref:serine C-palmitoyltransferase n=1 Tax=Brettanomyces naardenensis TaxID=13370 RepID=A0A448YL43_BRENA|nr:DEKNAAC102644 [Brettanomyces naardenensis]
MDTEPRETPQFIASLAAILAELWYALLELFLKVPGGALVLDYIRASHKNDPWRTLLEILLALVAIRYFLASKYSQDEKDKVELSEREVDELIADWEPEPIVPPLRRDERWQLDSIPLINGAVASVHVSVEDPKSGEISDNVLNLASKDYLSMSSNEVVKENSIKEIRAAGVGACGPPNFYGTQDVHVRVCEDLARFLGAEEGIIYGQDYCTPTSVLPCFLKRGDIVIVDGGVSLALQKAALISRSDVEWFNHNDLDHLEEILENLEEDLADGPLNRRFIVTEGLFENFGDSPDLKRLVEIKNHYKFRLVLDETNSVGTLGPNGRGLPEACGISRDEIEITIGSMAQALGSSGGYCVGCEDMIYHQILSSNAYVFSASLPPYCAVAASTSIHLLEDSQEEGKINPYLRPLVENSKHLHQLFRDSKPLRNLVVVRSADYSPVVHIRLNPDLRKSLGLPEGYGGPGSSILNAVKKGHEDLYFDSLYNTESYILQQVIDQCLKKKVLITRTKRVLHQELLPVVPELILHCNAKFTKAELDHVYKVVEQSLVSTFGDITKEDVAKYTSVLNN